MSFSFGNDLNLNAIDNLNRAIENAIQQTINLFHTGIAMNIDLDAEGLTELPEPDLSDCVMEFHNINAEHVLIVTVYNTEEAMEKDMKEAFFRQASDLNAVRVNYKMKSIGITVNKEFAALVKDAEKRARITQRNKLVRRVG